jgi:uncharacterized protein YndB with AHSA1/START domain
MRRLIAFLLLLLAAPVAAQDATINLEAAADGSHSLTHELVVPAAPSAVWQAVSTAEGWQSWAVPVARAVPGGDRFETNYDAAAPLGAPSGIEQEWLAREAPHRVSFRTTRTPAGFPHAEAYKKVVSTFELAPAGPGATRVRLTGTGYPAGAEGDALIGFFRAGNSLALRQLHQRFATGPIDWRTLKPVPKEK